MYNQTIVHLHSPTGGMAESALLTEMFSSNNPYQTVALQIRALLGHPSVG